MPSGQYLPLGCPGQILRPAVGPRDPLVGLARRGARPRASLRVEHRIVCRVGRFRRVARAGARRTTGRRVAGPTGNGPKSAGARPRGRSSGRVRTFGRSARSSPTASGAARSRTPRPAGDGSASRTARASASTRSSCRSPRASPRGRIESHLLAARPDLVRVTRKCTASRQVWAPRAPPLVVVRRGCYSWGRVGTAALVARSSPARPRVGERAFARGRSRATPRRRAGRRPRSFRLERPPIRRGAPFQ